MNLYKINSLLLDLVDEETGEILDFEKFQKLCLAKETKLENMALWIKNLRAEAGALKAEKDTLAERQKQAENTAEKLARYLSEMLGGQAFKTPKVVCSFRKSVSTQIQPDFINWAKANDCSLLKFKEPEPDKTAIKKALQSGVPIPYSSLKHNRNLSIK